MLDKILGIVMRAITGPLYDFINASFFTSAFKNVFFIENLIGLSHQTILSLNIIILSFSGGILTFKLLHKLFNIYIMQQDGDSTVSPVEYLKGYGKGIVVSLTFTVAYGWLCEIVIDLGMRITKLFNTRTLDATASGSIMVNIFLIVYFIFICIIYIHFLMNGVRLYILRLIMPFAAVGLIDNDNGLYAVCIKKIGQTASTVLIQMFLVQLSILPLLTIKNMMNPYANVMLSVAILAYSLKVTIDLNEIFLTSGASGGGSKLSSLGRGAKSIAGFLKK